MRKMAVVLFAFPMLAAPLDTDMAFDVFKRLQGTWAIQSEGKTLPFDMTYNVASNGSIVTEQFGKELSVIYRDGESLLMTHFCNRGNAPRLKLESGSQPGSFDFDMFDITNLGGADAPHVQKINYKIVDEKRIDLQIIWQQGEARESEQYVLTKR